MATRATPIRYVDRDVVGAPEQVANVLRRAAERGRLVAATVPVPAPNDPNKVWVRVRFRAPSPGAAARRRRPKRRALLLGAAIATILGLLAGISYLVWLALQALIAALPALLITLALLAWLALRRAGVCAGMHCPGCRHH